MNTTQALALSPLVTAYALESGTDIVTDTTAGVWGYFVAFDAWFNRAPGATGPFTGVEAVREAIYREHNADKNVRIIARFPAGTEYAYTL